MGVYSLKVKIHYILIQQLVTEVLRICIVICYLDCLEVFLRLFFVFIYLGPKTVTNYRDLASNILDTLLPILSSLAWIW